MRFSKPFALTLLPGLLLGLAWGCAMVPQQQSPRDPFLVEPGLAAPQQRMYAPRPTSPIEPTPGIEGSSRFQPPLRPQQQRQPPPRRGMPAAPQRTTPKTFADPPPKADPAPSRNSAPPYRSEKRPAPVEVLPDPIAPPERRNAPPKQGPTLTPPEAAAPTRPITSAAATGDEIELTIAAPAQRPVGSGAPLQLTVRNLSDETLRNISIVTDFDGGLEFPGSDQHSVTHKIPKIEAGDEKESRLTLIGRTAGRHRCQVVVKAGTRELVAKEATVDFVARQLEWQLHGPSERTAGSRAEFNIPLINVSPRPLRNVTVRVEHDAGLKVREMTRGGKLSDRSVTWTIDELAVDEGLLLQLEVECREPTSFACLTATVSGPDLATDDTEACLTVTPLAAGLDIRVQDVSDPVAVGDIAEFVVTVQNAGLNSSKSVELACEFPAGFQFDSATLMQNGKAIAVEAASDDGTVKLPSINRLDPDRRLEYRVRLKAKQAGPQEVRFTVRDDASSTPHNVVEPIMVHR